MSSPAASIPIEPRQSGGLRLAQLELLSSLWLDYARFTLVLWRNGDQIGILYPDQIVAARDRYRTLGIGRIKRERFQWLGRHDLDYLSAALPRFAHLEALRVSSDTSISR